MLGSGRRRADLHRLAARALDRLPPRWFERLRDAHAATSSDGSSAIRRRALAAAASVARHRSIPVDVFELADHPGVRLSAGDSLIARNLYWFGTGGWEGPEVGWWRRACAAASGVLELGANIGSYTVLGASTNRSARYVAVEPHPTTASLLRRNVELNGLTNVEVVEAAATGAASPGLAELAIPEQDPYGTPAGAFVRAGGEGVGGLRERQVIPVATVPVGDLVDGVDLLKLDIEGHEAAVLEALLDWLLTARPTVFVEVRAVELPRLRRIITELHRAGYLVFAIGGESLHLVTSAQLERSGPLPRYGTRDLILVDAAKAASL